MNNTDKWTVKLLISALQSTALLVTAGCPPGSPTWGAMLALINHALARAETIKYDDVDGREK